MRWRLALSGMAVALVTLVVFWVLIIGLARAGVADEQSQALVALATEAARSGPAGDAEAQVVTDPLRDTAPFVLLVDEAGEVVYTTALVAGDPPRVPAAVVVETLETGRSTARFDLGDGNLVVAEAVRWTVEPPGVALAGQSVRFQEEQLAGVQAVLATATVLTLLAAAIVSWRVAGRALRPLKLLAATADEIAGTGDLGRRLAPASRKDEVASLTRSFNGMLDRLEASATEVEAALERQRRFVADAGHELRSPLTTIRSNAGFLAEHPEADRADRVAAIEDVVAESDRMARLVGDLLTLARRDARRPLRSEPLDLTRLCSELASRAGISVEAPPDTMVTVDGDRDAVIQVLWILVDNARRHGRPPVAVIVEPGSTEVLVHVDDSGDGVPVHDRDLVFDRFYRRDPARSDAGSGLGLAIARELARAMGGELTAETAPTGGGRFSLRLQRSHR